VFVVSCFVNVLALTTSIYMLQVFDRVLSSRSFETLGYLTLIAVFALGVFAVLEVIRKRVLVRVGQWFETAVSPVVVTAGIDDRLCGKRPRAGIKDVSDIRQFFSSDAITAFFDGPWLPVFIGFLLLLHPWLGTIGLLGAIGLFVCALANDLATRRQAAEVRRATTEVEEAARDLEDNGELLRSMGMSEPLFARWTSRMTDRLPLNLSMLDTNAAITGVSRFLRLTLQVLILGVGAYLVVDQQLTSGGMIAGSIILARALAPVEKSIQGWRGYREARQAYNNLKALGQRGQKPLRTELPPPVGQLDMEAVRYTPEGSDQPILRNISFALAPGEAIGVIGPSGAGKSTLCRLLVGVARPELGRVCLDGAEISENIEQLGRYVGYLPQEVVFLSGSVAENISRFGPPVHNELIDATQTAGVHDLILALPEGYETNLGLYGVRLSGGQRQRLALARALYGSPRLLVLDEPSSNLDGEGQEALTKAVALAKQRGATVVIVAHQPQLMRVCDKMLVLQSGVIKKYGPRDEVMPQVIARKAVS
jgi:PrtD family type I secretion system ABC transporter